MVCRISNGAELMKKLLVTICSVILAFGLTACVGKAPVGKGKAPPPVVTRADLNWNTPKQ